MKSSGMLRRVFSSFLLTCLIFTGLPVYGASSRAEEYNEAVRLKRNELQEKYGIRILYPLGNSYAGIGTATLATLDTCLDYMTPSFTKQLSRWYKENTGYQLTISFTNAPDFADTESGHPVAGFTFEKALLQVYVPAISDNRATATGCSPTAIIHEFGHAYHEFLKEQYGASQLLKDWKAMNGGTTYQLRTSWDKSLFVSQYASISYDEDFADTFAYGFVCNRPGFSISSQLQADGASTGLGKKISFLEKQLPLYMTQMSAATANLAKCRSTAPSITWRGLRFSGNTMEYIGYNAPYGILKGTLHSVGLSEHQSATWERQIGGWVVVSNTGKEYAVFPGGAKTLL